MSLATEQLQTITLRQSAHPLTGAAAVCDPLMDRIGQARFVLIGEASHGTQEFYQQRSEITKRLIEEKGFNAVAVEADWPDAFRVNRYARLVGKDQMAVQALEGFRRFPTWMWRNTVVVSFLEWLRSYNERRAAAMDKVGFYGLDLYSLYASIEAVLGYLDKVDPEAAKRARYRYSCFEHFNEDPQAYGYAANFDLSQKCESEAITQLVELQRNAPTYMQRDGRLPEDESFYAEQNARLIKNAEEYFRSMFHGRVNSWNLRDRHMAETPTELERHLAKNGKPPKLVVWEQNSHLCDARATEIGDSGELNVGQLAREKYERDTILVGFTTYSGTVTAASDWDAPAERKRVRPALPDSYEHLFHQLNMPRFLLNFEAVLPAVEQERPRLKRAIGVIYVPETERISHYFYARLADQFDAVVHLDETHALEPLERTSQWESGEPTETFPTGV